MDINVRPLTVVQSNELVEASYNQNIDELRLLNLALTKIDSRKDNPGRIDLYPEEFSSMFGLKVNNVWRNMKNAIDEIMTKPIKFYDKDKNGKTIVIKRPWLVESVYSNEDDGAKLTIEFSPKITPYLFELKEKFTSLNIEYASRLTTSFSFRLYFWLIESKYIYNFKHGEPITVNFEVEWMKERAGILNHYNLWSKFKIDVIEPAINHINTKTDISVIWRPIKKGRSVYSVEFTYIFEEVTVTKPIRPRLFRRPKVTVGSHEEGVWMRKNLNLFLAYEVELYKYDSAAKINMPDLKKMVIYADKTGQSATYERLNTELNLRTNL